jgi:ketosteroid isomerase-like protein
MSEREGEERTMGSNKAILDRYVERYNAGDLDAVMDLYAEDAVQFMPDGFYEGRGAIRERLTRELAGLSDLVWAVESFVEDGDEFADEWSVVATHSGPIRLPDGSEIPPTGNRIELRGMEYVRVHDGEIVVDNLYYDNAGLLAQLGPVPAGATV